MAVTNTMIIAQEQIRLAEEGILKIDDYGNIEPIHTYAKWKELGYSVCKGEKAITKLSVWKYRKRKDTKEEEDKENGYCFMKTAAFFSMHQVQKIEK